MTKVIWYIGDNRMPDFTKSSRQNTICSSKSILPQRCIENDNLMHKEEEVIYCDNFIISALIRMKKYFDLK
jgi:hypothetical protein